MQRFFLAMKKDIDLSSFLPNLFKRKGMNKQAILLKMNTSLFHKECFDFSHGAL